MDTRRTGMPRRHWRCSRGWSRRVWMLQMFPCWQHCKRAGSLGILMRQGVFMSYL
uniref:Uncharacterized protein n=1 Tax=Arundo donax TaxID=35708 RepID=A0A0A8Z723_ARUDO